MYQSEGQNETKTKLLIVEDEPLFRELLAHTLSNQAGLEIIGAAEDGETALRIAGDKRPDVVLMDIELAGKMDGIEAALRIKRERPQTGIVILSVHSDRRYITSLPLDETRGWAYLLKQTVPDIATVIRAIEGSKAGMLVLDPELLKNLHPKKGTALSRLTQRQQEVLELIAQGYNNAAIAEKLNLSEKSVETYINVIYQELQLSHEPDIHARVKATLIYLEESHTYQ
jgi:DNA-binding NarL/FixJ family response regulator